MSVQEGDYTEIGESEEEAEVQRKRERRSSCIKRARTKMSKTLRRRPRKTRKRLRLNTGSCAGKDGASRKLNRKPL